MQRLPFAAGGLGAALRRYASSAKSKAGGDAGGVDAYFRGRSAGAVAGEAEAATAFAGARAGPTPAGFSQPTSGRRAVGTFFRIFLPVSGVGMMWYAYTHPDKDALVGERLPPELQYLAAQQTPNTDALTNWSGTHEATPRHYFHPENEAEVEAFLRVASRRGERLRPAGSALSPNGAALSGEGVLALGAMDRVLNLDTLGKRVTVQAGARVQQLAEALAPKGLALQNYASIREQQIGGITQVGAHGTGPRIPPVDEQVVAMRLSTPGLGTIALSETEEPELFRLARVGLGSLGVMTQATLRVVPRRQLLERTFTASPAEVRRNHVRWLQENQHIKYLYIPYTDTVVVVTCNPVTGGEEGLAAARREAEASAAHRPESQRTEALRRLYASLPHDTASSTPSSPAAPSDPAAGMSATQLRDALLAGGPGPLDAKWVAAVNQAEADYWRKSSGARVGWSDDILGFDCGGQQWVLEVAFPVAPSLDGLRHGAKTKDLEFVDQLLAEIAKARVPAPSPIEVRWTSGSSSPLSPAAGPPESLHCWVGVIMYLPSEPEQREAVTKAFREYGRIIETKLMPKYGATWHWAKLEAGASSGRSDEEMTKIVRPRLQARFGPALAALGRYRAVLDPEGTLGNSWLDAVIGAPPAQPKPKEPAPPTQ
ncbi:hypothetical protein HYH03_003751 [Edaphochlamys debaryana]|uniref:FAD-binding PCMH-type domain-containing protein n=1 Tax=Edaphochlamys debaryana TaxID=47281 RepID=A0A835YGY9_9CHLO|nr:hypothetical protein HYH03_003751 [Edaphochlamys debaryana]|eukprot:KAG2498500.1 hypothetical protein HYH03_003751 [Edaphochlamys debaryana]